MAASFEPFQDRLSRDIRNALSSAFLKAVTGQDPDQIHRTAALFLDQVTADCYRHYIHERLRRFEKALARINRGPDTVLWRAAVLWDHHLFFEVHELLELAWLEASGREKRLLQAMIRAAGVYIKLEHGYREAAAKMAGRARPALAADRDILSPHFDPEPLLLALDNPTLPPPQLLA